MSSDRPRVAILFDKLGPYHVARLNSASAALDVIAVEASPTSSEYVWDRVELEPHIPRVELGDARAEASSLSGYKAEVAKRVLAHDPAVLVVPGWSSLEALLLAQIGRERGLPVIAMSETNPFDARRLPHREFVKRAIVSHFSAGFTSSASQVAYFQTLGLPADAVFVGYNVVDNDYFAEAAQAHRARGTMPSVGGAPLAEALRGKYFLITCRFVPKKNLPRVLHAYAQFASGRTGGEDPWPLVLLGDGEMRSELEALARSLGIADRVIFAGFRQYDELPHFYATAGAMLLPSTVEQWGLVVNEALASGVPVAASTRVGSAEVLIRDGETGLTFDPFDVADIARTLERIAASETDRERWAQAGRGRVEILSPAVFGRNLADAVRYVLNSSARPSPGLVSRTVLQLMLLQRWRSRAAS